MPKKVALLIGVSEYGEGIPSLSAPLNDVAEMKRVLENPNMGGFDAVEPLINPDPTAMRLAVQHIFANCHKDDLVLLFFSGHGITDDNNRLYLATKGTSKDFYKATSVPASFIQDVSLESYAKRQAIVLDCCYSGAFAEGWQTKSVGLNLKQELGSEGRVVLTSSTATQTSFQQEGEELSLYTQYLVEGIETGAAGKKERGKIYAFELHDYAKAKVQEVKPKQKPEIILDKEGFNILLSQAPVNDPELDYRKLVEKYATEGRVTTVGKNILQVKRQEFGITKERADEIVDEVLAPYRKHLENIALYKQAFMEAVEQHYPLTERLLNELRELQTVLGLEDKDIAQIQQQEPNEYENKLQQYKQEFLKAVEREYPLSTITRNQINILQQSLKLRNEDIKRIEQPILAAKYQEQLKNKQRKTPNEKEAERGKQLKPSQRRDREEYENKLRQYTQEFSREIERDYPLNEDVRNKLESVQKSLGIRDEDVERIEQPLIVLKKSEYRQRLESERLEREKNERLRKEQIAPSQPIATPVDPPSTKASALKKTCIVVGVSITVLSLGQTLTYSCRDIRIIGDSDLPTTPPETPPPSATPPPATPPETPKAEEFYQQGINHYHQQDYQSAIADFNKAIELNPDYADAHYQRGLAYSNLGDYQSAITDYDKAIKLNPNYANKPNPNYAEAFYNRGLAYSNSKDYQSAIADYNKAIELNPDYANEPNPNYAEAFYNRGLNNSNSGDYQSAIADYTKAIELNLEYSDIYYNRGLAHSNLGDYQNAIADFTQAINRNQNWGADSESYFGLPTAYFARGSIYFEQADYQAAIEDYNLAIERKEDYSKVYFKRGNIYKNWGITRESIEDYQAAIEDYNQAIKYGKNDANAYFEIGNVHYHLKDYQTAIENYDRAINDLNPEANPKFYYNRGLAHKELGDREAANEDFQKAAELYQSQGESDNYQNAINQLEEL